MEIATEKTATAPRFSNYKAPSSVSTLLALFCSLLSSQIKKERKKEFSELMENLPLDRKKAIEELEKGRELVSQLLRVIKRSNGGDDDKTTSSAQDLAEKVERSFSNTLLLLKLCGYDCDDFVPQMQQQLTDSSCLVPAKSDDSEVSCKSSSAFKERRGCYKRRYQISFVSYFYSLLIWPFCQIFTFLI